MARPGPAGLDVGDCKSAAVCWAADSEQAQSRLASARAVPRDRCDLDHPVVASPGVAVISSPPALALLPIVLGASQRAVRWPVPLFDLIAEARDVGPESSARLRLATDASGCDRARVSTARGATSFRPQRWIAVRPPGPGANRTSGTARTSTRQQGFHRLSAGSAIHHQTRIATQASSGTGTPMRSHTTDCASCESARGPARPLAANPADPAGKDHSHQRRWKPSTADQGHVCVLRHNGPLGTQGLLGLGADRRLLHHPRPWRAPGRGAAN